MTLIEDFIAGRPPAELYDTYLTPGLFEPFGDALLEGFAPEGSCLDVACGTGALTRKIARYPDVSKVVGVDVAAPMVSRAKENASNAGLSPHYEVASVEAMPFSDGSFDATYCQQGIQFFPDKAKAFGEIRRVTKTGGVFAGAVWTAAYDGNPVFAALEDAIARRLGEDLTPLGPFSYGDCDVLKRTIEDNRFDAAHIVRRELDVQLPDVRTLVLFDLLFLGRPGKDGGMQPVVAPDDPAGDAVVETLIADIDPELSEYAAPGGMLRAPMTAHFFCAVAC